MEKWLVIGGGNGGQATAGHLALLGRQVRLYDIFEETCDIINSNKGIFVKGAVEGFGEIEFATTDMEKALDGVTNIIVVAPAFAHADIAKQCAPWLKSGQRVLLHPSSMFGSLDFLKVLEDNGNNEDIVIGETISLLYAARLIEPGTVNILGVKDSLPIAVFPSSRLEEFGEVFGSTFPQMKDYYSNILETGLQNIGCVVHPLPTMMSTSMIESDREWLYYYDGITESVARAIKEIDKERMAIGEAAGIHVDSAETVLCDLYGVSGDTLDEITSKVKAYGGVKGQKSINTRYITEEIPYALIPMISLAKKLNVKTPMMEATVVLAESVLQQDFHENARTMESIGLGDMDAAELLEFLETGLKNKRVV